LTARGTELPFRVHDTQALLSPVRPEQTEGVSGNKGSAESTDICGKLGGRVRAPIDSAVPETFWGKPAGHEAVPAAIHMKKGPPGGEP